MFTADDILYQEWELEPEQKQKKKIKLYRYTIQFYTGITKQLEWTSLASGCFISPRDKLLLTEEKEIEITEEM
jgi:hypothetical protein